jgi:hypothetical protein
MPFGSATQPGQFVRFTYMPPRPKPSKFGVPRPPSDPRKEVMVLNPNWQGKMHAIDLHRVTPAETQVLRAIMDPKNKQEFDATGQLPKGAPTYPLIMDVFRRMDPTQMIRNPMAFYSQFVKPFIRDKDCYRQYFHQYMSGITVIRESQVRGAVFNPKPLFRKI